MEIVDFGDSAGDKASQINHGQLLM